VSGPLEGRRILVTRRWPELAQRLAALGATAVEAPLLSFAPPSDPARLDAVLRDLAAYDWLVFTSANAVDAVARRMEDMGLELAPTLSLASVGPATTEALRAAWPHAHVEVQPVAEFRATSLLAAFDRVTLRGKRVLLPVSNRAADTVARGLEARGAHVDTVVAYTTVVPTRSDALERELARGVAAAALASPSAVTAFCAAAGTAGRDVPVVVIGPTTEEAARDAGLRVRATADPATVEGMVRALSRVVAAPPAGGSPE